MNSDKLEALGNNIVSFSSLLTGGNKLDGQVQQQGNGTRVKTPFPTAGITPIFNLSIGII